MTWSPILYREFYDIPRAFVVERARTVYFFDCRFDDRIDEYPDRYRVYRLDPELTGNLSEGSWEDLSAKGVLVGEVLTDEIQFDPTRRVSIEDSIFARL
jgi:hypothetical protein